MVGFPREASLPSPSCSPAGPPLGCTISQGGLLRGSLLIQHTGNCKTHRGIRNRYLRKRQMEPLSTTRVAMGLPGLPAPSIRPLLLTGSGLTPSNKVRQRGFRMLLWERDVVSRTSLAHITNLQPSRGDSAHTANLGEVPVSNRTTQRRKPQKAPEIRKEWT